MPLAHGQPHYFSRHMDVLGGDVPPKRPENHTRVKEPSPHQRYLEAPGGLAELLGRQVSWPSVLARNHSKHTAQSGVRCSRTPSRISAPLSVPCSRRTSVINTGEEQTMKRPG